MPRCSFLMTSSLLMAFSFCSPAALAAQDVVGTVDMQGAIVDSACAIAMDSRFQVMEINPAPVSDIIRDGSSPFQDLTIRLEGCIFNRADPTQTNWQYFRVTFYGAGDDGDFALSGSAGGLALQITDGQGHPVSPGVPLPATPLTEGDATLSYPVRLVGNTRQLNPGNYYATINYQLTYY